jgi:hypothetical protein
MSRSFGAPLFVEAAENAASGMMPGGIGKERKSNFLGYGSALRPYAKLYIRPIMHSR